MSARSLVLLLILILLSLSAARAQAPPLRHLPPPLAKGGYAGYLVPSPLSGPLGFHVRGTLIARSPGPGEADLSIGVQAGLSFSLTYGEAGASFVGSVGPGQDAPPVRRQGPVEVWMRAGPFYPVSRDRSGLLLSAFGEYAVARDVLDGGGTLLPETTTLGLIAGWHRGFTEAHLSGAYQRAEGGAATYHGVQLGAAFWLRTWKALQVGGEALWRSGCSAGSDTQEPCRLAAMGLAGVRVIDEHGVGVGLALGGGWGAGMPTWAGYARFGFSLGKGFRPPPREAEPLIPDIDRWLAARRAARQAQAAAQQLAQQQITQQQQQLAAQAAAQRQALAHALALRYPLGGGPPPQQQPPDLVSPVCVRRPCGVAGWRFDQAVDEAVNATWSKPEVTGPPPRSPGRGIAQAWRPPPRPQVRPPRAGRPGRGSPLDAREPYEDRESGERETARRAQERERERVWGTPETPWPSRPPTPHRTMRPDPRAETAETAEHAPPPRIWYQGGAEAEAAAQHARPPQSQGAAASPASPAQVVSAGTARGGAGPVRQGQRGVEQQAEKDRQAGNTVDGQEITVKTPLGRRRMDILVTLPNGQKEAREVKTGNSPIKLSQQAKDDYIEKHGGVAVGKNAQRAGVAGPIRVRTKVVRLP